MNNRIFWGLIFFFFFLGCKTIERVSDNNIAFLDKKDILKEISLIQERKLFENVLFKRTSVFINSEFYKQNFKCNIALKRDSFLRLSIIGPIGIEVSRVSLEPDAITIIDRVNRQVIFTDYSEINSKLGFSVNFEFLQNFILNEPYSFFALQGKVFSDFQYTGIDNSMYLFSSVKKKGFFAKIDSVKLRNQSYQQIWIGADNFCMRKNFIQYADSKMNIVIDYGGFKNTGLNFYFPYNCKMDVVWGGQSYYLEMRFSDIQFNASNLISFSIPKKYDKIYR